MLGAPWYAPRVGRFFRQLWSRFLLSLVFGAGFAWLAARGGLPLWPPKAAFAQVAMWAVPTYAASLLLLHALRAARFRFLVAPVKELRLGQVLSLNFIGFLAIYLLPLRLGEFVRPALGKARHGIPLSTGVGTVAVERVVDGLITSACVMFVLLSLPRELPKDPIARSLPLYALAALLLFCAAFAALAAFLWQRARAMAWTRALVGLFSKSLAVLLAEKVDGVADGLRSIGSPRLGTLFLLESLAYWLVNALGVWALGVGCGLPGFSFGHAVAVMGILAIGILLPTGPGLFGTFQLAVVACLRLYYPEDIVRSQGSAFILLLYVLQSLVIVGAGLVPLYLAPVRLNELAATSEPSDAAAPTK